MFPFPAPDNEYLQQHITLLCDSYQRLTGATLLSGCSQAMASGEYIFKAPFVVLSHTAMLDPIFNYANQQAMSLFAMTWQEICSTPSRLSAEPDSREERLRLLERVAEQGFIDDYSGVRIAKDGQRFLICQATVWNVVDEHGTQRGQAATFNDWQML